MSGSVEFNAKKLFRLVKLLQKGFPSVKVGILGSKAEQIHNGTNETNAYIGFLNEFGSFSKHIPARSFIRMPLKLYLDSYIKNKKSLSKEAFEKAIEEGKTEDFSRKVGLVAEEVIQDAFATRGFGNWKPNAPRTIAEKGSDSPLIDTGQLRRSITSKVIKNDNER